MRFVPRPQYRPRYSRYRTGERATPMTRARRTGFLRRFCASSFALLRQKAKAAPVRPNTMPRAVSSSASSALQFPGGQHFHGEGRGGERCSEKAGKSCGYACDEHYPLRLSVPQPASDPVRYGCAELDRDALPARAAAEEMVSQVAQMTKGTRRKGMASRSAWPTSKTMPMPFSQPAPYLLYAQAMSAPISPRKGRNQAVCASRTAPRYSSTRPKTASTAPTAMPVGTATAMRTSVFS